MNKFLVLSTLLCVSMASPDHGAHPHPHSPHHASPHHPSPHHFQPTPHHQVHHQPAVHHQPSFHHQPVHHQPLVHHQPVHHQPAVHQPVHPQPVHNSPYLGTLAEVLAQDQYQRFSTLLTAVEAAGLVDTLNSKGPFTVFAPTNKAFEKVPADTLKSLLADKKALTAVLLRHVVSGKALEGKDVPPGTTDLETAGGETIYVTRDTYITVKSTSGEASVVDFDLKASNGVAHAINAVI